MSELNALQNPVKQPVVQTARRQRARAHLDLQSGRGLEIGPLFTPVVYRHEADIRYVDIHSAQDLRDHFREDPNVPVDDIVDVDYVLIDNGTVRSVGTASLPGAPYEWAIASHVIEHIPDLIAWLADLASVLADDAKLSLVIPDRRYCFDVLRPATTVGDILLANHHGDTRPSVRAAFDHFQSHVEASVVDLWQGVSSQNDPRTYSVEQAWGLVDESKAGEYIDSHVWLFTPLSFIDQMDLLSKLGMIDFAVVDVLPTPEYELEFYATLRRLPRHLTAAERRSEFERHLGVVLAQVPPEPMLSARANPEPEQVIEPEPLAEPEGGPEPEPERQLVSAPEPAPVDQFIVSDRERRLILVKRRVGNAVRGLLRRGTPRN